MMREIEIRPAAPIPLKARPMRRTVILFAPVHIAEPTKKNKMDTCLRKEFQYHGQQAAFAFERDIVRT